LRHDGKLTFTAEVIADIPLGKELAAESGRFALGRNGIGHHNIDVGAPDGFFDDFAAGEERRRARRLVHHDAWVGDDLAFSIFRSDD
jgi:hypothetical protein